MRKKRDIHSMGERHTFYAKEETESDVYSTRKKRDIHSMRRKRDIHSMRERHTFYAKTERHEFYTKEERHTFYGVALVSRIDKILGLFCKIAL